MTIAQRLSRAGLSVYLGLKAWVSPRVAGTIGSVRWTPSVRVIVDVVI